MNTEELNATIVFQAHQIRLLLAQNQQLGETSKQTIATMSAEIKSLKARVEELMPRPEVVEAA